MPILPPALQDRGQQTGNDAHCAQNDQETLMTYARNISISLAAALMITGTGAAQAPNAVDLFAFAQGTRIVAAPEDVAMSQMDSSPLNLIDGSAKTDWTGEAKGPPVFVFELEERSELDRIAFDTAFLNRDAKAVRAVRVEISDTSATSGFATIIDARLQRLKDNQNFSFDPKKPLPVGRWVRLTIVDNYSGDEYSAFTGFRGYGRKLTADAKIPDVTGSYEGLSGWGAISLTQQGDRVTGCYEYQQGKVTGTIKGRTMTLDMVETSIDGSAIRHRAFFGLSRNGKELVGIGRNTDPALIGYYDYYKADRIGNRPGSCN